MSDRRTVTVRDEHGHLSEIDVPDESEVYPFKHWTDHLASGRYVVVEDPGAPEPAEPVDPDSVPTGSIGDVVDWVRGAPEDEDPADGWLDRASEAYLAEFKRGDDARKGITDVLRPLLSSED